MSGRSKSLLSVGIMGAALLGACAVNDPANADTTPAKAKAHAALTTAAGAPAGKSWIETTPDGLRLTVEAKDVPPGIHGIHIHTTGKCDAPDFQTAGGHWNPTARQHGHDNPQGAHRGDLPNITVGADGRGMISFALPGATLTGDGGLFDADGAALVIHATADDLKTDPSGNSGGRIACGVFAK
jgi:Cu-Zn family superoxide dismutase